MRTLQTSVVAKYLLAALATGIILLAAPVGASAEYRVVPRAKAPAARDHRVEPTGTVHDHRAVPTVIDHRAQPTVNAHRPGTTTSAAGGTATYTPRKKKVAPKTLVYSGPTSGYR